MVESPEEQNDLNILHAKQATLKQETFDYMRHILHMDDAALKNSGQKSVSEALNYAMRNAEKRLKNLVEAHIAKYPDER